MQRRSILLSLVLAPAVVGTAGAQQLVWQTITGADGRYSVEMPTPYREVSSARPGFNTVRQYIVEPSRGVGLDFVIYDFVQGMQDQPFVDLSNRYQIAQDAVKARWPGATLLDQSDVTSGPVQGRSFVLSIDGGQRVLSCRLFYNDQRVYDLQAITVPQDRNNPAVARFLNSLRIVR